MGSTYTSITSCRICQNTTLIKVIDLGEQVIASQFPYINTPDPPSVPLVLVKCMGKDTCGLVQLLHTVDSSELYQKTYGYRSGLNATMTSHLKTIVEQAIHLVSLQEGDIVLDIGSNDGTLLHWYDTFITKKLQRIGIDPTGNQFREFYAKDIQLIEDYFTEDSWKKASPFGLAKIITSIAMFYDIPNPILFMEHVKKALHPEGIWIMEQSYLPTMLETHSFDTICHEHLEYYGIEQIIWMCEKVEFRIIHVSKSSCNGGSFRVVLCHQHASFPSVDIQAFVEKEKSLQLHTLAPYETFRTLCDVQKRRLLRFIKDMITQGKKICLYGASTKGNTLLQYYGLDNTFISCAAERNPLKYGRWTPKTHIPIVAEKEVREGHPDFLFVLPWHFKEEFLTREASYLDQGGQFLFPLPEVHIVSHPKKALLTGITGQIGSYMKDLLVSKGYLVYGICQELSLPKISEPNVFYLTGNLQDKCSLEDIIYTVLPDEIYHFAGITNSYLSKTCIQDTWNINNKPVEYLLDILKEYTEKYGKNIPFFHSSSVEIWKGSCDGYFNEGSVPLLPTTPYGISKAYTFMLCNYYRKTYQLPIYQGIFGSIESPRRREGFVLQKVAKYVASYIPTTPPLCLGDVNVYRDWLHAKDAVEGVYLLVQSGTPTNALITKGEHISLQYAIQKLFSYQGIHGEWNEHNQLVEDFGKVLVEGNANDRVHEEPMHLKTYDSSFLRSLGWSPQFNIHSILKEYITTYLDQLEHL